MTTTERVLATGLAIGLLTAVPSGCGADPEPQAQPSRDQPTDVTEGGEPADPASGAVRPTASVGIEVAADDDRLLVDYSVTNDGKDDLLVVNRLPQPAGAGTSYVDDIAYASGKDDGRVQVAQRVFPWPDSDRIDFGQAPHMGATGLPPGESLDVHLEVAMPLERRQPFGDDLGYGSITLPDPVTDIVFCLGVIAPPYPRGVSPTLDPGDPSLMLLAHGDAAHEAQYLFCSDPVEAG
ncbi:MAG: hypothetical protein M3237_05350 [Actinomycetota bacterium]|nr:hypothetical protein [Actinomycetota bacterium]